MPFNQLSNHIQGSSRVTQLWMDVAPHHNVTTVWPDDCSFAITVVFAFNARTHGSYFSGRRDAEEKVLELPSGIAVSGRNASWTDKGSLLCLISHDASMISPGPEDGDGRERSRDWASWDCSRGGPAVRNAA
jgi:hypothetical protein